MYVEFLQEFGSWKKGDVSSDIPDGVARSLVEGGTARAVNAETYLRNMLAADIERRDQEHLAKLQETVQAALRGNGNPKPAPPNGGGGVNFNSISAVDDEDRDEPKLSPRERKRAFGEICRLIFCAQAIDTDPDLRRAATERLRNKYGAAKCVYKLNDQGEIEQTVTRTMDYGVETITRTGTESVAGGPSYGFAVRPVYTQGIYELPTEQTVFVDGAFDVPIGNALEAHVPAWDQYSAPQTVNGVKHSASFAGVSLTYKGEIAKRASSDAALSDITFKIVDLTAMTDFSRDLLMDDQIGIQGGVERRFRMAYSWMEDYMAIWGDGVGKPEGFMFAKATLTGGPASSGTARTAANNITIEDLTWMMSKLHSMCWGNMRWIAEQSTIPKLAILRDSSGVAVFQPNALVAQAMTYSITERSTYDRGENVNRPMGLLLGRPIYFSEKMQTLGTTGDICLADPSQYGRARRAGLEIMLSDHFYFDTDRIAMRMKLRHDMRLMWRDVYTQAVSGNKVAPAVVLK